MNNPWLDITEANYVGHMSSPAVGQRPALGRLLGETLDIHLRKRFSNPRFELDIRCGDLNDIKLERDAYDMVHAALLFEYLEWPVLLPRVATALRPGAVLSVILQVPSTSSPAVTPTPFTSLRKLEWLFRFVETTVLVDAARREGLTLSARRTEALPAGKAFEVLRFIKNYPG